MAINRNGAETKYMMLHNGVRLKKGYHNTSTLIWSAGGMVTYHVDTDVEFTEEVDYGATCLAPTTFTPTKSGWTFVGWREDTAANSSVLTNKTMGIDPVTLYAVFEKDVTATFISYDSTTPVHGKAYYNNGNAKDYTVTAPNGAAYTGWTWRGWSGYGLTEAEAVVVAETGDTLNCGDTSRIFYGLYKQVVTATFISYEMSAAIDGLRYYNAAGNVKNASVVAPTGAAYSGWTWRGWSAAGDTAADASVNVPNGGTITGVSDNMTYYGLYKQTITLSYNGNSSDGGSVSNQTGTRYYNSSGKTKDAQFTLAANGYTKDRYKWIAWTQGSASGTQYASGASVTLSSDTTFYAVWERVYTPYYAIQDGSLVNCPNAVIEQQGGHSNKGGVITLLPTTVYGAYGHTSGSDAYDDYWGAYTGDLSTEGCTKLSFTFATFETAFGAEIRDYWVYGDGVEIEHETISSNSITTNSEYITSRTVDVSNYSTIAVRVRVQDTNVTDAWMGAGFTEVRLHV